MVIESNVEQENKDIFPPGRQAAGILHTSHDSICRKEKFEISHIAQNVMRHTGRLHR